MGAVRIASQGAASAKPALAGYGLEIAYRYSLPCQMAPTTKHKFAVEGAWYADHPRMAEKLGT